MEGGEARRKRRRWGRPSTKHGGGRGHQRAKGAPTGTDGKRTGGTGGREKRGGSNRRQERGLRAKEGGGRARAGRRHAARLGTTKEGAPRHERRRTRAGRAGQSSGKGGSRKRGQRPKSEEDPGTKRESLGGPWVRAMDPRTESKEAGQPVAGGHKEKYGAAEKARCTSKPAGGG